MLPGKAGVEMRLHLAQRLNSDHNYELVFDGGLVEFQPQIARAHGSRQLQNDPLGLIVKMPVLLFARMTEACAGIVQNENGGRRRRYLGPGQRAGREAGRAVPQSLIGIHAPNFLLRSLTGKGLPHDVAVQVRSNGGKGIAVVGEARLPFGKVGIICFFAIEDHLCEFLRQRCAAKLLDDVNAARLVVEPSEALPLIDVVIELSPVTRTVFVSAMTYLTAKSTHCPARSALALPVPLDATTPKT